MEPLKPSVESAKELFELASLAANDAADAWLKAAVARGPAFAVHNVNPVTGRPTGGAVGYLLDLCGNAHVQFRRKNSKWYNAFKKAELVRRSGNGVIEFWWKHKERQEYGLHVEAAEAAAKVLQNHGVDVRVWSYVD